MKKLLSVILAMMIGITMLTGCGKTIQSGVSKKESVTLTFGSHQSGLPTSGIVQELAQDFEKETGIKIDFQISPDAQWRDLLKVKLDANEAPDIFCADADPLSLYSRLRPDENCLDLTDQEFVKRMDPSVLPSISHENKVYAITFPGKKIWVYCYNKQIFADLGLEIPKTYEEFKDVCQKIKDAGITPVYEATQNGWHQVLPLFETGPMYENKYDDLYKKLNNNEMNIAEIEELELIITQLQEFADLGFYGTDFLSNSIEGDREAFANGEVAMSLQGIGWPAEVESQYPETKDNIGIFVMPWADNQVLGINPASNAYFANSKSKYKEEVLKFFEFLARPENLKKRLEGQPDQLELCWPEIPSRYPKEYSEYLDNLEKGTVMQAAVSYVDTQWMEVGKDLEDMYAGGMTPKEVVQSIANRRDEQAKLQKDPAWNK